MKKVLFFLSVLVLAGFLFESCKKDASTSTASDAAATIAAEDLTAHNDLGAQIDVEADAGASSNLLGVDDRNDCPVVTLASPKGTWPNTITLDYSDAGCTKDGRVFKGKIVIYQTNKMSVTGASRTFTFVNFSIDGAAISGSRSLTNNGLNASGQPSFTRTGNETIAYPDGTTATHNATHTLTMVEGFGTAIWADDVWNITGTGSGTNRKGATYTVDITKPLVKSAVCPWIKAGTVTITVDGATRTLDYGDGTCDKDATLTLPNGTVKQVKIKHHWWK
jgi:hypothetical protein